LISFHRPVLSVSNPKARAAANGRGLFYCSNKLP
jgi:hypothetical protein